MTQHKAEEALRNPERLLRSLADASLDAIYIKDRDSRWLFANPALQRIAGKSAAELLGKTDVEIYSNPEIGRAILEHDRKIMDSRTQETFEEFVDLPDGRHFFISVKLPRFDEKGNVIGLIGISHDITNRRRREEQLRESQQKYRDLMETTIDFVWEVDPQGRYTYCGPQMEKLWGIAPSKMIGKVPFDKMPREARKEVLKFFESLVSSKKPFAGVQVPSFDGQGNLIYIEISGVPFFDDEGTLLGYRGITRDITERKKAEEEMKDRETLLSEFLNNAPSIAWIKDLNGRFLKINKYALDLLGLQESSFIGHNVSEIYSDNQADAYSKNDEQVIASGKATEFEETLEMNDGSHIFRSLKFPIRNSNGKISGVGAICTDITDGKRVWEALKNSERKFRDMFETSPLDMALIRLDGSFIDVNDAAVNMHGFSSKEELIKKNCFELVDKEYHKTVAEAFSKALECGYVNDVELVQLKKDGQRINTLASAMVMFDPEGKPYAYLTTVKDITIRKKAEEDLAAAQAKLQEYATGLEQLVETKTRELKDSARLAAIGATAGMVGHDIRNPLQTIVGELYLIKSDLSSMPKTKAVVTACESLTIIERNIDYINKIVLDLQDYTRPINPVSRDTDLKSLVEDAIFKNGLPDNVKASCEVDLDARQLLVDPDLLTRAFKNLVVNAAQSMPNGGNLSVRVYKQKNETIIEIIDTGVGIPEEAKSKLFTPLFTTKAKGQGFGLAVVKRVVEALNGSVSFDSQEGKGSTFFIRLPNERARQSI